jgi:hypothetical protein
MRLIMYALMLFVLSCPFISFAQQDAAAPKDTIKTFVDTTLILGHRLQEECAVGPYRQAEWTTKRRFPSTRVYIQTPPGSVQFEQWLEIRIPRGLGKTSETRLREEFAFGLNEHLQLDIYLNTLHIRNEDASMYEFRGWSAELRWAPADWNVFPGNPTLYFEYLFFNGAPDRIEPKLLLGGELARRWHWGLNLIHEREIAGAADRDVEYAATAALGYSLVDESLSLGAAFSFTLETERSSGTPDETSREWLLGPSIQFRPHRKAFLDIEPLFGITKDSRALKMFIVFGWEF